MNRIRAAARAAVVLAVLVPLALAQAPDQDSIKVPVGNTMKDCGLTGTAKSASGKALNRRKNRYHAPAAGDIDSDVSLAALLAPGDDLDRFDDAKAGRVVGFVVDVKVGGVETCNCRTTDPDFRDTHIDLGAAPGAPPRQRVVAEVSPRLRLQKAAAGIDWKTATLREHPADRIKGKWVEITGWLTFDTMHVDEAENTNPGDAQNWRATAWELHPVTDIRVLPAPPPGMPQAQPDVVEAFQRTLARQLRRDPRKVEALRARNRQLLAEFDPADLDEEIPK